LTHPRPRLAVIFHIKAQRREGLQFIVHGAVPLVSSAYVERSGRCMGRGRPSRCDMNDGSTERRGPSHRGSNAARSRRAGCCANPRSMERWIRRPNRSRKGRPSAARGDIASCDRDARAEVFWGERAVPPSEATSRNNQPPAPSDAPESACSVHPTSRMQLLPAGRRRSIVSADERAHTSERRNAPGATSGPTSTRLAAASAALDARTRDERRDAMPAANPILPSFAP
jgi:hypothetical protein